MRRSRSGAEGPGMLASVVPVAVDGVIYFASGYSVANAVDAKTGKLLGFG